MSDEIERWAQLDEQATPGPLRERFGNVISASGGVVYTTGATLRARAVADATLAATDLTVRPAVVAVMRAAEAWQHARREYQASPAATCAAYGAAGDALDAAIDRFRTELRAMRDDHGED